jgi:CTP:molybdopterin cytidylyltransferase MocA
VNIAGLVLAAGAGRRFGTPKALVEADGEPLLTRALRTLTDGGCGPVRVVLGAGADAARELLPDATLAVFADDWAYGMGASLRAGLTALEGLRPVPDAALVHLVDLPWVGADVVARIRALAAPGVLARATYDGVPGHPVLLGRNWWSEIVPALHGDRGARDWLSRRSDLRLVECADLGSGTDVDTPADLGKP